MELLVPVLFFLIGACLFIALTFGIWRLLRPHRPDARKLKAYECGEEPSGGAHGLFNSRFYVVALMFLLFEAELPFLFPWATAVFRPQAQPMPKDWVIWVSIEIFVFVALLTAGLAYAWRQGCFDWGKNNYPKPFIPNSPIPRSVYESFNKRQ